MSNERHKYRNGEPTAKFQDLTFEEQAKSISATVNSLGKMIDSNVRRGIGEDRNAEEIMERRLEQVQRMIDKRK